MIEELFDSYESCEDEAREAEIRLGLSVPTKWQHRSYEATQAAHNRRHAARKA
jgi:hypothetical protein